MVLELALFGAQPNVNDVVVPTLSPALLAVDFDQTLTERDTTAVIVEAAIAALPSAAHQQQQQASFNSLALTSTANTPPRSRRIWRRILPHLTSAL